MTETLQRRLTNLEAEYQAGEKMLADLDARRSTLTQTLLRIEGAMQVLRELMEAEKGAPGEGGQP